MKNNFWFITLCAFLIIALSFGWSMSLRVAVIANAMLILLDVTKQIRRYVIDRKKENG